MSLMKHKWSVLSIKDKHSKIVQLKKRQKGINMSAEYGISKQQICDIHNNKEKIMKFADILRDQRRTEAKIAESCKLLITRARLWDW